MRWSARSTIAWRTMKLQLSLPVVLLSVQTIAAQDGATALRTFRFTDPVTALTVAAVQVELPKGIPWRLEPLPPTASVTQAVMATHSANPNDGNSRRGESLYTVSGLVRGNPSAVELKFTSPASGRTCSVQWDPSQGNVNKDLLKEWSSRRAASWMEFGPHPRGSVTSRWMDGTAAIYGGNNPGDMRSFRVRNEGEPMDTMAVFGGRCAITETLQLRDIEAPRPGQPAVKKFTAPVPVSSLPGVAVKSHPFAEMARGVDLPPLALAALCPPDRFFAFFPQPKRIRTVIEQLGEASQHLSSPTVDGMPDYRLWEKYLARLGLDEKTVRAWIEAGQAESVAFTLPDLFIRDATDITFLIRMKDGGGPALFKVLPETDEVLTVPGKTGQCHVARRGNVLIASTSRTEAMLSVKLADAGGKGSLGASDELRCMRQKLPDSAATVAWCYFSDPFIRRLTGPEVKIGQHRRLAARERIEALTAAALLYQLDHGAAAADRDTLIRTGYAHGFRPSANRWEPPAPLSSRDVPALFKDVTLAGGPLAASNTWGSLPDLKPLSAFPVGEVTAAEAEMYSSYVQRYQDYWRRYFDPIAIRLDETAPGAWAMSTFILPLVDNSLYKGLKENLDTTRPAAVPLLQPEPVALLAIAVKPAALAAGAGMFPALAGDTGLTGRAAIAFPDSDPVLQLGGIGGMQQLGGVFGGNGANELAGIGLLAAMLTRPFDAFFELENEARAMSLPDSAFWLGQSSWLQVRRVTREGDDRRLYVLDFGGFAQIHVDLKVENGWLHLSNHPWSNRLTVTGTAPPERGSAVIRMNAAALQSGAPAALFQAQNDRRSAVLSACSELLPWMDALGIDSTTAQERQFASMGMSTSLPHGIRFTAERPLTVPAILTAKGEILTAEGAKADPGILAGITRVILRTSFEDDGLRAELEWLTASPVR